MDQQNLRTAFEIGSSAGVSSYLHATSSTWSATDHGTITWISPRLNQLRDLGKDLEVPIHLIPVLRMESKYWNPFRTSTTSLFDTELDLFLNFVSSVKTQAKTEDCALVMGKKSDGYEYVLYTQTYPQIDDMVVDFEGPSSLALVRAGAQKVIGKAELPGFYTISPLEHHPKSKDVDMDIATLLSFSDVTVESIHQKRVSV